MYIFRCQLNIVAMVLWQDVATTGGGEQREVPGPISPQPGQSRSQKRGQSAGAGATLTSHQYPNLDNINPPLWQSPISQLTLSPAPSPLLRTPHRHFSPFPQSSDSVSVFRYCEVTMEINLHRPRHKMLFTEFCLAPNNPWLKL